MKDTFNFSIRIILLRGKKRSIQFRCKYNEKMKNGLERKYYKNISVSFYRYINIYIKYIKVIYPKYIKSYAHNKYMKLFVNYLFTLLKLYNL